MTPLRGFLLAIPFAVLLAGCPIYSGDGGPDVRPDSGPRPCVGAGCVCETMLDCDPGLVCESGRCTTPDTPSDCRTHGDCAVGDYCEEGTRECTGSSTCSVDSDCSGGFICDFRGTCVPEVPGACRDDADCDAGTICVEGFCRDQSDTCQFNYECAGMSANACLNNGCTAICTDDSDCAGGQTCQGGFCRAASECSSSSDCAFGSHCVDERCLVDCESDAGACDSDEYCAADGFCRPAWQPEPFCTTDAQCASTSVCVDGVCRTPCPTGTDDECRRFDVQLPICAADMLCYSTNETAPECAISDDCGASRSCVDGICRNDS